jgi:hypothetical protein
MKSVRMGIDSAGLLASSLLLGTPLSAPASPATLFFSCRPDNDLFRVISGIKGIQWVRFDLPSEALQAAPAGAGVLVLADGYPATPTAVEPADFAKAAAKQLRLFIEYPASLPDLAVGLARRTSLENVVATSNVFGPDLQEIQLLALHDCHFVEMPSDRPLLVAAKVAGFDRAVYGLADTKAYPILFAHPTREVLVSTTKLSQFITARYAPKDAMQAVWAFVLGWLQPGSPARVLDWTPTVRPTFGRDATLPADAARQAIVRGIDWHTQARMLLSEAGAQEYKRLFAEKIVGSDNPVGPALDESWPAGDGRYGVLEGVNSRIDYVGNQPIRWCLRSDSNGETSLAFALRWKLDGETRSREVAGNLLDWVYVRSGIFQNDPAQPNYGLLFWTPENSQALYHDNDVKAILGCLGTAGVLGSDRWDEVLVKNILGNFRTTGKYGFRGGRLENPELMAAGWLKYWQADTVRLQPHYEAWIWATYLWLYDKTHYRPLLEKTRTGIEMMMAAYPDRWRWTNGIQQERGRMLLALAWLVRVDDRPEYRAWLKRIATDIERAQDSSGAIREELGEWEMGDYHPSRSNAEYGTTEASLIQQNGDAVADLLYTVNFTFLGLQEAFAATGDPQYERMSARLAEFLVRIQVRSEAHPLLDGGWFRAFDFDQWEYFGSNGDAGWGAWAIEVGWTQAWIPTVLTLRELHTSLWDISRGSTVGQRFDAIRREMLPDEVVNDAAVGAGLR